MKQQTMPLVISSCFMDVRAYTIASFMYPDVEYSLIYTRRTLAHRITLKL